MITVKEFSILKACLQFASEELGPHCPDSFHDYLPDETVTAQEMKRMFDAVSNSQLFYARITPGSITFIGPETLAVMEDISVLPVILVPEPG